MAARLTVRALCDFHVGPSHDVAISKGSIRHIDDPGPGGPFYTTTLWGTRFGLCRLGREHGWEVVKRVGALPRAPRPAIAGRSEESALALGPAAWEQDKEDEAGADDWDDWPV